MKQADLTVSITKGHDVPLRNVTPLEALFLVAEHHRNCGGCPIDKDQIKNVTEISIDDTKDGKPVKRTRTVDEETDRLRAKYNSRKIDFILQQVRDIPEDFPKALERGIKVAYPGGLMGNQIAPDVKLM